MFEELYALSVLPFFQVGALIYHADNISQVAAQKKYCLPSTGSFFSEEEFARVHMGYNEESLIFHLEVFQPFQEVDIDNFRKADSIELFIDTRDIKDKTFVSQFCHHFIFFPEKVHGVQGKEITKFRTEEVHVLCKPNDLIVQMHYGKKSYVLDIEIPSFALFGYDPASFRRLGFTYQINRKDGLPQHFALSSSEYKVESQPSLWASLALDE